MSEIQPDGEIKEVLFFAAGFEFTWIH